MRIRSGSLALALLAGTALVAPFAAAQPLPAPNAAPVLDRVVAGGITIRQDAATTQVTQTQQRGIVDWRGFDVGRDHTVQFRQPSAGAATLNRVTGPDPSVIAGRITANGQVAIVNRSGVVFTQGAQVEAAGLIVSAAGITNANFLAGGPRLAFDQAAHPGARVENAGTITIREAGLAGLVAPQVENSGTIVARMGRVALAGGEAAVVDLHGDGLVSLEITRPVTQAPGDGGPLVRNTGTIEATGGAVLLTAAAADGIVQDLVHAGGRIAAETDAASGQTGTVALRGTGGAIIIEGEATARGTAPGTRGGAITALADRVLVTGTGRVDASGAAGGGSVGIGAEGRRGTPRIAERAGTAPGAEVRADATQNGPGGTIRIDSLAYTAHTGTASARGGPAGGDGGLIEVSGAQGLRVTGDADISAPAGRGGTVLLDPITIDIIAGTGNVTPGDLASGVLAIAAPPPNAQIDAGLVNGFAGNLRLEAGSDITVSAPVNKPSGNLELASDGGQITINAPLTLGGGDLGIEAVGLVQFNADVTVSGTVRLLTNQFFGQITQSGTAALVAPRVEITAGQAVLPGPNRIGVLADSPVSGTLDLRNTQALAVSGTVGMFGSSSIVLLVDSGDLTVDGIIQATFGSDLTATSGKIVVAPAGEVLTNGSTLLRAGGDIVIDGLVDMSALPGTLDVLADGSITLGAAGTLLAAPSDTIRLLAAWDGASVDPSRPGGVTLAGAVSGGDVTVGGGTAGIIQTGGNVVASTLTVAASGGGAVFDRGGKVTDAPNVVLGVGATTVAGDFVLDNGSTDILVAGPIQAANIGLRTEGTINASQLVPVSLAAPGGRIGLRGGVVLAQNFTSIAAGTVEIAPDAPVPMVIGGATGPDFLVAPADLAVISATDTLRLGGTTFGGILDTTATSVQFVAPLALPGGLDVRSLGTVGQDPGANLAVGALSGAAGGATVLANPGNVIGVLGDYASGGAFTLATAGGLGLTGHLDAPGQTVDLTATGGVITSTATGRVTAGLLTGVASGGVTLANPLNAIGTLGDFTSGGAFTLANAGGLGLTGHLDAPGQTVALTITGGAITSTTAGRITAGLLTGAASGGVALANPLNIVGALGNFTSGGAFTLETAGGLGLTGHLDAPGQSVDLTAAGGVITSTPTGRITANTLALDANGAITLTGANAVRFLGSTTTNAAGDIAFATSGPLTLTGTLAPGPLGAVLLDVGGGLDQTAAGAITAGWLGVTAAGNVVLTAAPNTVSFLDASTAPNFALGNTTDLHLAGLLDTGVAALTVNGILDQTSAGTLSAAMLTGSAASVALMGTPNAVQTIGNFFTPGTFLLDNAGPGLTVLSGAVVESLEPMTIVQAGGPLTVDGTVRGDAVTLSGDTTVTVNGFSAIAGFGDLVLDAPVVTVNGLISAGNGIFVNAPASATLGGVAIASSGSGNGSSGGLWINSPAVTFTGLNASGVPVFMDLGFTGTALGAIDAGALLVGGGTGATLTGSIAGNASGAAAALGQRADTSGMLYGDPPPNAGLFTFNGCALATVVCGFVPPPPPPPPPGPPSPTPGPDATGRLPPTIADTPWPALDSLDPALDPAPLAHLQPESPAILIRLPRDRSEEDALAPADVRVEDY